MSEFQTPESYQRLIGPPPGYVGYDAGGELTNGLRENPYSIVLFDEIEKGSSRVFDLLLQVLSDGHLSDNKGRVVDCKNSVFVMTSNAIAETSGKDEPALREELKHYRDPFSARQASLTFRPEFLDRLEIVPFDHLESETLQLIAQREVDTILSQAEAGGIFDCRISIQASVLEWILAEISAEEGGARAIQRVVESRLGRFLAEEYLEGSMLPGGRYSVNVSEAGQLSIEESQE